MKLKASNWKTFYLSHLYEIKMGNKFDKNKMTFDNPTVNLVSRQSFNNGVDEKVDYVDGIEPYKAGLLTVALGGCYLGSCFVQREDFYTAQNIVVMCPKFSEMSFEVNIFISTLVRYECQFKYYAFGRELNTHINKDFTIDLPVTQNNTPDWNFMTEYIKSLNNKPIKTGNKPSKNLLNASQWKEFKLSEVFTLKGGFYNKKPEHSEEGDIPFLGSTETNNGVTEFYSLDDIKSWNKTGETDDTLDKKLFDGNCIAVTVNGSVCNAFYQYEKFTCSHDITVLYTKNHELNIYEAMFLCTIITNEKYRWSYGRKPHDVKKFGMSVIKLPVVSDEIDWKYMEKYIKELPFGDKINKA